MVVKLPDRWPYHPPERDAVKPLSEVYRPRGMILISEAIEIVGKSIFGEEWIGEELKARSVSNLKVTFQNIAEESNYILWPDGIDQIPGSIHSRSRWRVITSRGTVYVQTEEEAHSLWWTEKPKLIEMWKRESAARKRYEKVVVRLRSALNAEVFPSWAHQTITGHLWPIPAHVWARDDIPSVFDVADSSVKWLNPNRIEFLAQSKVPGQTINVQGRVLLKRSDIDLFLAPTYGEPPAEAGEDVSKEFVSPYLAFMLRAVREIGIKPEARIPKETIESWLRNNWPDEFGKPTARKIGYMATFLRHPDDEKGGYYKPGRDG